jgi:uncharacterized membrane protein YccC
MKTNLPQRSEKWPWAPRKSSEALSWFSLLKQSLLAALRVDRTQLALFQAIPGAIGIALPLSIGIATGHVSVGVAVAGGAALLGPVGLTYTSRARTRTLLLACVGIALAAFVSSVTGDVAWLSVLTVGVWGIGAGLLVAISQRAMVVGLQSTLVLIILTHFGLDPAHAAIQAALLFAGALLQTLLAILPSPWKSTSPERAALNTVYQQLANYAENPQPQQSAQVRDALLRAQATLADTNTGSEQGKIFSALLEEAERIRLDLLLLIRSRQTLQEQGLAPARAVELLDQVMHSAAEVLRRTAWELQSRHILHKSSTASTRQPIKAALAELRRLALAPEDEETIQHALLYGDKLRDRLHRAKKLAKSWKYANQRSKIALRHVPRQAFLQVNNARAVVRANLTLRSTTFRHAIRLGVALALATTLYHLIPGLQTGGYLIPLTVLLVLRPDFTSTFSRGLARMLGTMLGAVLAALAATFLARSLGILVLLDVVALYLAYATLFANYAIFSVFITMGVVFLLSFITLQPPAAEAYRAIDTAIGGVLALLIYILWPTWERWQLPGYLADRFEAVRRCVVTVLRSYAQSEAYSDATLHALSKEARLARSNAATSIQNARQEPELQQANVELAQELLDASDAIVRSALTLEAYLLDNPAHPALPAVSAWTEQVDDALGKLATAMRQDHAPIGLPAMQEALHTLEKSGARAKPTAREDLHFVVAEARRIVSAIDAVNALLSTMKIDDRERKRGFKDDASYSA